MRYDGHPSCNLIAEPLTGSFLKRLMVSASDLTSPENEDQSAEQDSAEPKPTTVLLLPSFTYVDAITPSDIPELTTRFIDRAQNTTGEKPHNSSADQDQSHTPTRLPPSRACPHDYVILLCSHRTRDARCGVSAP